MDSHRFDTLTKQLSVLLTRRAGLRVLLAGLAAGVVGLAIPGSASGAKKTKRRRRRRPRRTEHCRGKGEPCQPICCSGRCLTVGGEGGEFQAERKRKRKQKCRRHDDCCKVGKSCTPRRCDCSKTRELCRTADDCCSDEEDCGGNACDEDRRCCRPPGGLCINSCECCGPNECDVAAGRCEDTCIANGQPCATSESCCDFPSDGCSTIGNSCGDEDVCCAVIGSPCGIDCDCCSPLKCQSDGTCNCIAPHQRGACESDTECCLGAVCGFDNVGGGLSQVCCLPEGSPCGSISECCFQQFCLDADGGGEKECVPFGGGG